MNVIILGSGGCVSTPRAGCNCRVCTIEKPVLPVLGLCDIALKLYNIIKC